MEHRERTTLNRARALRGALSPPEVKLWLRLRRRSADMPTFRRQHPVGPYILDFYCAKAALCVEVDGEGHRAERQHQHDLRRTAYLNDLGIEVVRYSGRAVMEDADAVVEAILHEAKPRIRQRIETLSAPGRAGED